MASPHLTFSLEQVPFSRAGAYQSFSRLVAPRWWFHKGAPCLVWRTQHGDGIGTLAKLIVLRGGKGIAFEEIATPEMLTLRPKTGSGWIEISFHSSTTVVFRGHGLVLRLEMNPSGDYDQIQPEGPKNWRFNFSSLRAEFLVKPKLGSVQVKAPWNGAKCLQARMDFGPVKAGQEWEVTAQEMRWEQEERPPITVTWKEWRKLVLPVPKSLEASRELAAYVTWSALVDPCGNFQRPAMVMSKNWMMNVWSWDHCFNAIALAERQPKLAWDQFMIPFDLQTSRGQLPDFTNDRLSLWNFVKPPIHGWALGELMNRTPWIGKKQMQEIYPKLLAWTEWWLRERDSDNDGLPQYNHGNDSGWDNNTCFKVGMPVEGPELAAFLVLQLETLARIARRIGKPRDGKGLAARAQRLLELMLRHHWRDGRFEVMRSGDHAVHASDSLLPFMPLVLGDRLPSAISAKLVAQLKEEGRFLTPYGLATESLRSDQYEGDGYVRGPIWAPMQLLIISGLQSLGENEFAREIARRFCRACAGSGMDENFNAVTGKGQRDGAYTWTASVFLTLASDWLTKQESPKRK